MTDDPRTGDAPAPAAAPAAPAPVPRPLPYMSAIFTELLERVAQKRGAHVAAGYGPAHDDAHSAAAWLDKVLARCVEAARAEHAADAALFQADMVAVAAIALAAAESVERQIRRAADAEPQP